MGRNRDRKAARQLPDGFVNSPRALGAKTRIEELVSKDWKSYDADAREQLVEKLMPVLEPLFDPGAVVGNRERDLCEGIIARWVAAQ